MDNPKLKLCILRLSAIGDVCNCLAAVKALQAANRAAKITWIIGRTEYHLIKNTPGVDFIIFDKRNGMQSYREVWGRLPEEPFDVLLNMHASMRANILSLGISANRKVGYDRTRARDYQWLFTNDRIDALEAPHVVEGFMQFVADLDATASEPRFGIDIDAAAVEHARQLTTSVASYAVISPMSSERANNFRNWPTENYAEIVDWLQREQRITTLLTGGPSERELAFARAISEQSEVDVLDLTGQTDLPTLYALIKRAKLVIAPDSGPVHIANAAATPVVGLYATSNPERTGPYRYRDLVANAYPDALAQFMNKSVDTVRWGQRVRNPNAMALVSIELVKSKARQALSIND